MKIVMCILIMYSQYALAQNSYKGGIKLQLHSGISVGKDWKLSTRFAHQQLLFNGLRGKNLVSTFHQDQSGFQMILNRKISNSYNWGLGCDIHLRNDLIGNRFIQQFAFLSVIPSIVVDHRLRLDETVEKNEPVKYRMGYRIGFEKVLKKKKDGLSKMYIRISNEYRHVIQAQQYNFELNPKAYLGFNVSNKRRLAVGFDCEAQQLLSEYNRQALWFTLDWY
jgi:hypothetical protein